MCVFALWVALALHLINVLKKINSTVTQKRCPSIGHTSQVTSC